MTKRRPGACGTGWQLDNIMDSIASVAWGHRLGQLDALTGHTGHRLNELDAVTGHRLDIDSVN